MSYTGSFALPTYTMVHRLYNLVQMELKDELLSEKPKRTSNTLIALWALLLTCNNVSTYIPTYHQHLLFLTIELHCKYMATAYLYTIRFEFMKMQYRIFEIH